MCGLSTHAVGQLLCQYIAALCPDDTVNNLFTSSAQPEVPEQYNISPTFLSLRDLSVYNVDACIANSVFDTELFDGSRQLLAAVLDSLNAVNTARYLSTECSCAVLASSFNISNSVSIYLCMFVRKIYSCC